jgi:phenylacetate-CoA ligase
MGWIGMTCSHGHMHLNEDSFYFEFINKNGESASENENAELCISSIDQGASPHIRYKTGDFVRLLDGGCGCGSKRRVIQILGRESNFISFKNELLLSPYDVDQLIGAPHWLDVYQLEQLSDDEFVMKFIVNDSYESSDEDDVIKALRQSLNDNAKIRVNFVDYIPTERSGKFQAVKGISK